MVYGSGGKPFAALCALRLAASAQAIPGRGRTSTLAEDAGTARCDGVRKAARR